MKRFDALSDLEKELIGRGFQSYNLRVELEQFDDKFVSTIGSCGKENIHFETFEWLDENKNDVFVEIAVVSELINADDEELECWYVINN